jgi:pimeloyl-ACP methyl ester carboxylesterase
MKEHRLTLPHGTVHYWEYHRDKSPTVVMVHGFRGTHHGLAKIADNLSDFHLIVPDLPGFGASQAFADSEHSVDRYVAFLKQFINELHLKEKPVIVGHSFGSIIASHFVAAHPEMADKLILINPIGAPALEGPRGVMTRLAIAYYWLGRKLPTRAAKSWLGAPPIVKVMSVTMAKTTDKELKKYIHDQHRQHFSTFASPDVVAESFKASVSNDVSHVAHKLTLPTLLIAGHQDDITPLDKQHQLHKNIPTSQLHVIDNVGHLIHYEKPTEAADVIRRFLQ